MPGVGLWGTNVQRMKGFREPRCDLPRTERPLTGANNNHQHQKFASSSSRIHTLSLLDIGSIRYVPLDADDDILKFGKFEGGRDIIRDTLLEQNCRVFRKVLVCCKSFGKGWGIIVPWRTRDYISRPGRGEGHRR